MKVETLHYQEHSTMASTWQTEIIAYADEGGGCTLKASVHVTDCAEDEYEFLNEDEDTSSAKVQYESYTIETADEFEEEWDECRKALDEDDCLDLPYYYGAIDQLKKVSPMLAKQLDLKLNMELDE